MLDLRSDLGDLPTVQGVAPWPGFEHAAGWGVFGLPFDSGHFLAMRVIPVSDFGPYRTLWHRDPQGRWAIYVDGPRVDTACPRYFGPACDYTGLRALSIDWEGPASVRVRMESPDIDWRFTARETPALRAMNRAHGALPLSTWRSPVLIWAREGMVRALGMGSLTLSGTMPSGHVGTVMPTRIYLIDEATATVDGVDLGHPVRTATNPSIGGFALPARGVLAVGQGAWEIRDPREYALTRSQADAAARRD